MFAGFSGHGNSIHNAINSSPSSELILKLTQLAMQLIADFDHLSNSISWNCFSHVISSSSWCRAANMDIPDLPRHFSLSFITSSRSSGLHPISSHSCYMYVRAGHPAFAWPYEGVHRSTSLMSWSLLLQQCPACLVHLAWIVFVMEGWWPYSWCLVGYCHQDLFNIAATLLCNCRLASLLQPLQNFWITQEDSLDSLTDLAKNINWFVFKLFWRAEKKHVYWSQQEIMNSTKWYWSINIQKEVFMLVYFLSLEDFEFWITEWGLWYFSTGCLTFLLLKKTPYRLSLASQNFQQCYFCTLGKTC